MIKHVEELITLQALMDQLDSGNYTKVKFPPTEKCTYYIESIPKDATTKIVIGDKFISTYYFDAKGNQVPNH